MLICDPAHEERRLAPSSIPCRVSSDTCRRASAKALHAVYYRAALSKQHAVKLACVSSARVPIEFYAAAAAYRLVVAAVVLCLCQARSAEKRPVALLAYRALW
jgi:hypothetical protein